MNEEVNEEVFEYEFDLDQQEGELKKSRTVIKEFQSTIQSNGWKRFQKWLEDWLRGIIIIPRVTKIIIGYDDKGRPIKRLATLEENAIFNIKIEERLKTIRQIFYAIGALGEQEEAIKERLKEIQELKKGDF